MASMVGRWRNWRAVEGIWQLNRLAYVVFFLTRSLRANCAIGGFAIGAGSAQTARRLRVKNVKCVNYVNYVNDGHLAAIWPS